MPWYITLMATKKVKSNKTLIIVESPAKIKKLSSILGPDYVIRASFGHIKDLAKGKGDKKLGIDFEKGYAATYKLIPDKKDKLQAIIDASTGVKEILIATDPDREGACIAAHLYDVLESTGKPIKRISFNEITKTKVLKSLESPRDLDQELYQAAVARRVLDRIVGFMVSPYLINVVGPKLSAGRVQSVATRLIVDREREIESFIPEEYWNITAQLAKAKKETSFSAKYANKITNEKDATAVKNDLEGDTFKVTDVEYKEKKRNPYPPLITSSLQQAASVRFGLNVSRTMQAAQSLYEAGLITYMRTDSTRISAEALTEVRAWIQDNGYEVPSKPNFYTPKKSAQDGHEAIRPTEIAKVPDSLTLSDDQAKVYRVIWERFVACQMEAAIYDTVSLKITSSSDHLLKANGRVLKYAGWLAISSYHASDKNEGDEDDVSLPVLKVGDKLILVPPGVKAEQKFTQPPSRYNEASLVKELEKRGIGRPSTYADIIEKIKFRGYVEIKNKAYHATQLGKQVVDILVKYFSFLNYDTTAKMEEKLDEVASGDTTYVDMLDSFYLPFQKELDTAYHSGGEDTGIKCPECQSDMKLRHGKFGYYLRCSGDGCKKTLNCDLTNGKPVVKLQPKAEVVVGVSCPDCNGEMVKKVGKFGPYYSCQSYPVCKGTRSVPTGIQCEKCGSDMSARVFSGEVKLACVGYYDPKLKCKNIIDPPPDFDISWAPPTTEKKPYKKKWKNKSK